jgi:GT2 family glycosyltransferase
MVLKNCSLCDKRKVPQGSLMHKIYDMTVIIIGRNEYVTLEKNLVNLCDYSTRSSLCLQVIYVDSQSSDGSVKLACGYKEDIPDLSVIRLEGNVNAAVARNVGIQEAKGKYILFLDGDVVLDCEFIHDALDCLQRSSDVGAVTGKLFEVFNSDETGCVVERASHGKEKCRFLGGNFVCSRAAVEDIGLFDTKLVVNEDIDFTVRLAKRNLDLIQLNTTFGLHFTEPYNKQTRLCRDLARFKYVYPGVLLRKYLFRRGLLNIILSQKAIYIRLFTILLLLLAIINPLFFAPSIALFLFIVIRVKKNLQETLFSRALSFLQGVQVLIGLFYLKRKNLYKIEKVI